MALNSFILRSSIVGALGGLLFGFDTAVISGTTRGLGTAFNLTPVTLGITVSIALWGTLFGAVTSGHIGDYIGGRDALKIMALLYFISAIGCGMGWSWFSFLIFRFIGGIGVGGSSVLAPVYIAELAPARLRGRLVGMFQINVVFGILLAYMSNYLISRLQLGKLEWRWEFAVAAFPAALFGILLFMAPCSPRWLITRNRIDEAQYWLELLGSPSSRSELKEIIDSIGQDHAAHYEPIFQRRYIVPIALAITLGIFNQLAGINAVLYYLNDIFSAAGFSQMSGSAMAVMIGVAHLIATIIGMAMIDHVGRKALLLIGSVGTSFALASVAEIFHSGRNASFLLGLLVVFLFFFSISQGAVIWVYISEIFPTRVRSKGQSLGSSAHWIANAIIATLFPLIAARSKSIPFAFFASMMAIQFVVVSVFFPETKGKALEQIQRELVSS